MKIIFLIISCLISCELTFKIKFKNEFYSIKENLKNFLHQIKNLTGSNDHSFQILIKIFSDYLKIVFKFIIMFSPLIIYFLISTYLEVDIMKILTSLKINFFIFLVVFIYIYLRKKIV